MAPDAHGRGCTIGSLSLNARLPGSVMMAMMAQLHWGGKRPGDIG
jgi:hypothetical protein